jgi:hypothetical protein
LSVATGFEVRMSPRWVSGWVVLEGGFNVGCWGGSPTRSGDGYRVSTPTRLGKLGGLCWCSTDLAAGGRHGG